MIWDPSDGHGHGSARAERVRPDIFWGKFKFGRAHLSGIGPEGCDDVRGADRAVSMVGVRVVADRSGPWASMSAHAEEDVDARSNQAGYCQLRSEVREGFPSDSVLLVFQGEDGLGGVLKVFNWGASWEGSIPNKEDEVQEGAELGCLAVTGALGVFT